MAEADTVDLLMVFPPRPIRSVITVIPLLPFNVITMRFMLPLDVVRGFARPPRIYPPVFRASCSERCNHQDCCEQEGT